MIKNVTFISVIIAFFNFIKILRLPLPWEVCVQDILTWLRHNSTLYTYGAILKGINKPLKWASKLTQIIGYILIFFAGQTYVLGLLSEPLCCSNIFSANLSQIHCGDAVFPENRCSLIVPRH